MRTTTDNRTTYGQLKMLSAFHQKKMRTTFIFKILMRITFWKCGQPKIFCISSTENVSNFFSRYDTYNMKMLPAFHKKKMWTTWQCYPHFIKRKSRQHFLQRMIQTTWKSKMSTFNKKWAPILPWTTAIKFLKIQHPKIEILQFVASNLLVFWILLQKQAKLSKSCLLQIAIFQFLVD